jgi:hypothetical protein
LIGEEFRDEVLVEGENGLDVGALSTLRVQVIGVEFLNPIKHALVVVVHEMAVSAVAVSGIKRVVAEHVLRFFGNIAARNMKDVLVVSEREMNLVEAAIGFVNAELRLIFGNFAIGVSRKEFRENNLVGIRATDREGVAYNGPLRLSV